jgi:hypothetical protein
MRHSIVSAHRSWLRLLALAVVALAILACGFEGGAFGSTPTPTGANRVMVPAVSSSAPSGAALDLTQGPVEAILITSPQPGQGARGTLRIEGLSDPAIAQLLNVVVRDAQGTVIGTARPAIQAQSDQRSTFSAEVTLPPDVPRQTGRVQVYAVSPSNNGVTHLASVEVELNGEAQAAVPIDPQTPEAIAIIFPSPNAEVKDVVKVAAATMLGPKIVIEVRDAKDQTVGRVEQNVEQTTGLPAQVMTEVPIQVSAAGPGRVLMYVVNARDGATEHLSSIEVNLVP